MSTAIYRCFDKGDRLLYIGRCSMRRMVLGSLNAPRLPDCTHITLTWYKDDLVAPHAERQFIHLEKPL